MKYHLDQYKKRLRNLIPQLPRESDISWLVSAFKSLEKACALNYKKDAFSDLRENDQIKRLLDINAIDFDSLNDATWLSGYFFNNAMFRMVALAEIGLKILFEKHMKLEAPDNYHWLSGWYGKTFSGKLTNINNARTRVNHMKHEIRKERKKSKFEKIGEAIKAFDEVLTLFEKISRLTIEKHFGDVGS
jgi:hypothetical protein